MPEGVKEIFQRFAVVLYRPGLAIENARLWSTSPELDISVKRAGRSGRYTLSSEKLPKSDVIDHESTPCVGIYSDQENQTSQIVSLYPDP